MTCESCRNPTSDSKIKVAEGARSAIFRNSARALYFRTRVDGCLLKNVTAADFVVTCTGVGSVIVELKGVDVEHAVEQVDATANYLKGCTAADSILPLAGLVICSRYPRFDTKLQSITKKFVKRHKAPLHVVARNDEFDLDRVLAFDGPR